jgi:hypothetical protein
LSDFSNCRFLSRTSARAFAHDLGDGQVLFHDKRDGEQVVADFHDVIGGAAADRLGGGVADVLAGHQDDRRRAARLDLREQFHAGPVRQVVVR